MLGPHNVPEVTDVETAAADPSFAVLSAIAHAKDPDPAAILDTLGTALRRLKREPCMTFTEFTAAGLANTPAGKIWSEIVTTKINVPASYFRHSDWAKEVREEGRKEGLEQARKQVHLDERAANVILVLEARGLTVSDEVRRAVRDCKDPDLLSAWLRAATAVQSADDLLRTGS